MSRARRWLSLRLARELTPDALDRFLRYVRIDTTSDPHSTTYPSSEKQLDLLRLLADECREADLAEVALDEHGYVTASVPATVGHAVPTLGLIAHVDTYPGVTGTAVNPQVIRYESGDLALPGDPAQVLSPREMPLLNEHVGHELVTSDGTTLLGADDTAGVAEIMAAAAYLIRHPEIEHGRIRVLFNPDEEIGVVEIAQDDDDGRLLDVVGDLVGMDEPLASFSGLVPEAVARKRRQEVPRRLDGVHGSTSTPVLCADSPARRPRAAAPTSR